MIYVVNTKPVTSHAKNFTDEDMQIAYIIYIQYIYILWCLSVRVNKQEMSKDRNLVFLFNFVSFFVHLKSQIDKVC